MTFEQFIQRHSARSFALFRVERGPTNNRKMVWVAQWHNGYFTSDTDRLVDHTNDNNRVISESPFEAMEKLDSLDVERARERIRHLEEALKEAKESLEKALSVTITTP